MPAIDNDLVAQIFGNVFGVFVILVLLVAYLYLALSKYGKANYDMRFVWACNAIKVLAIIIVLNLLWAIFLTITLAFSGGLKSAFFTFLMIAPFYLSPIGAYISITNLRESFQKRYILWSIFWLVIFPVAYIILLGEIASYFYR